jgi:hypothetical protein
VSHAGTLSVCSLAGSEQVAGMKEVADWRCLKLDAKTLPNSQQQKRTKTQMFKTNCLNCTFLLLIDQFLKRRQFQPNGTKMVQLFLKPPHFFQSVFSLFFLGNINYLKFFRSRSVFLIYLFSAQECDHVKKAQVQL